MSLKPEELNRKVVKFPFVGGRIVKILVQNMIYNKENCVAIKCRDITIAHNLAKSQASNE